jgi:hypothetical protein
MKQPSSNDEQYQHKSTTNIPPTPTSVNHADKGSKPPAKAPTEKATTKPSATSATKSSSSSSTKRLDTSVSIDDIELPTGMDTAGDIEDDEPGIIGVTYADGCCRRAQRRCADSADTAGFNHFLSWTRRDLPRDLLAGMDDVMSQSRGAGYWSWKPVAILAAMRLARVSYYRSSIFAEDNRLFHWL